MFFINQLSFNGEPIEYLTSSCLREQLRSVADAAVDCDSITVIIMEGTASDNVIKRQTFIADTAADKAKTINKTSVRGCQGFTCKGFDRTLNFLAFLSFKLSVCFAISSFYYSFIFTFTSLCLSAFF